MRFVISIYCFFIALFSTSTLKAQLHLLSGEKHAVICMIPDKWEKNNHPDLPFFLKPIGAEISPMTYMYVFGIDYETKPSAKDWITANNDFLINKQEGVKIIKTKVKFSNLKDGDYTTNKYEAVTYEYANERKEIIVAVECQQSIITIVFSAKNAVEFKKLYPYFKKLAKSIRIESSEAVDEA